MPAAHPRFDEPEYTTAPAPALGGHDALDGPPLPELVDPASEPVAADCGEPLVAVRHRRIRCLSNYWHAGWRHATAETLLRAGVARRLGEVADELPDDWGLAVFDAWRPLPLQIEMYEASIADPAIVEGFMAEPRTDPMTPPPHLSGGAVDLTFTYRGAPLALGTGFDDTTARAYVAAFESQPGIVRDLRRALFRRMADAGFVVYPGEWWHYELGTSRWAAVSGATARYAAATPPSD